ncbi:L-gulonolactone D-arabinono-1,4-lactone oxidase [Rickenella mellea]|uniref:D-arabinono-1,4-lactone oxidase n=1 Tax=Rickenella mellea TaxID=50990 RepID=A0A4Y7QH62_9AGAM|nr:L-gulonolactone D-arabinono-1,4-lactone oxidase [Rickenella mellea]
MPALADVPTPALYHLLQPITVPPTAPRARFTNWGRTYACTPLAIFEPHTETQCALILELARREHRTVRFAGIGHSPSDLACTKEFMLRTINLNHLLEVNAEKNYVVVQPGITLESLHEQLAKHNLAMTNLGSISEQTLAGCITTATHGTGISFGVMSTQVLALTLLLADGSKVVCSELERPDLFKASLCSLGCTGLLLSVKLQVEPAFRLKEEQETLRFDDAMDNFDRLVTSAEHVRFWWFPQNDKIRYSAANRSTENEDPAGSWVWHRFFGHHLVQLLLFIGRYLLFINTWTACFAEWLISGRTMGVDKGHRIFNVDCRYPQYTTEWAVPYQNTVSALRDLRSWLDEELVDPEGLRPHFPVEIRFSSADDIWLSPSYGQRTCWIGIVQYKPYGFIVPYRRLFKRFEMIMTRHGGKPHWAKAHCLRPKDLRRLYPRFADFTKVLEEVDPVGLFQNEYIRRHVFGEHGPEVDSRVFKPSR